MGAEELIRRIRQQNGLSQTDLADVLEVSRQAVNSWEKGTSNPSIANLYKISALFDFPIEGVLEEAVYGEHALLRPADPRVEYEVGLNAAFRRVHDLSSFCRFVHAFRAVADILPFRDSIGILTPETPDIALSVFQSIVGVHNIVVHSADDGCETVILSTNYSSFSRESFRPVYILAADTVSFIEADAVWRNEHFDFRFRMQDDDKTLRLTLSLEELSP